MDSVFASDSAATIAALVGTLLTALSLGCIGLIFGLRGWSERVKHNREIVIEKWETTLFRAIEIFSSDDVSNGEAAMLSDEAKAFFDSNPHLEKRDLPHLLYEWNYLHESLAGDSKRGLNFLAEKLNLSGLTLRTLKSPLLDRRLLAINTLGNLGDTGAYGAVESMMADRDPIISSWAWRALFRMDTAGTLAKHLSKIASREDWSPIFVARVLQEIEPDTRSGPLCRLVEESYSAGTKERQMSRLISYLSLALVGDYTPLVNKILIENDQTEVLIACLRLVNSDDDLTRIRELIDDDRWEIRMQVVLTLGRLGHEEDVDRLIDRLNDTDWWVRYRTASVLIAMPGMTEKRVEELTTTLPNQFARDVLLQVLTETRLLCFTQTSLTLSR